MAKRIIKLGQQSTVQVETCMWTLFWNGKIVLRFKISKKRGCFSTCSIIVSLTQKLPQRSSRKYISFRIYKVSEEYLSSEKLPSRYIENALNLVEGGSGTFYNAREVSLYWLYRWISKHISGDPILWCSRGQLLHCATYPRLWCWERVPPENLDQLKMEL